MWVSQKMLRSGVNCLYAWLHSSIYVPGELSMDSTSSNGLFQDKKCVFSVTGPITVTTFGGFLLTRES